MICSSLDYFPFVGETRMPTLRRTYFFSCSLDNPLFPFRCLKVIRHLIFVLRKHSLSLDSALHNCSTEVGKTAIIKWVKWKISVSKYLTCCDTCLLPKNQEIKDMTDISHVSFLHS